MRQHVPKEKLPDGTFVPSRYVVDEAAFHKMAPATEEDMEHAAEVEDLVELEDPTEYTMLHALRERYSRDTIFTSIGPVLVAVNPYKAVNSCKAASLAELARLEAESLPAHAFAIASAAYSGLVESVPGVPQSILVSGESGAGKTETTKLLVACLAMVSSSSGAVVEAALESGLLLEAFGNARTVFNNNSSRFGKWCAVHFDDRGRMAACKLTVYLLEQSRIVAPAAGERNYHIFYHLLAGASEAERREWALLGSHSDYTYMRGEPRSPGIDDAALWLETNRRMRGLGFGSEVQRRMLFQQVAALLALGNVTFARSAGSRDGVDVYEAADPKQLHLAARLLQVSPVQLGTLLTSRVMLVNGERITVMLNEEQCVDARDALAKAVYSALFNHLVDRLNFTLDVRHSGGADGGGRRSLVSQRGSAHGDTSIAGNVDACVDDPDRYIGLLDIFGFENFRMNGFEQVRFPGGEGGRGSARGEGRGEGGGRKGEGGEGRRERRGKGAEGLRGGASACSTRRHPAHTPASCPPSCHSF